MLILIGCDIMAIPKKIAIIGTHCARKSTLCHLLIGKLKERKHTAVYMPEVASTCPFQINQFSTLDAQLWILVTQMKQELELRSKPYEYLVLDRSILDNYVYMQRVFDSMNKKTAEDNAKINIAKTMVHEWLPTYDYMFKVKPMTDTVIDEDGIRDPDLDFQQDIENRLENMCRSLNTKNLFFLDGKNEYRIRRILETINGTGKRLSQFT
jgi:hypothetical protein